MVVVRALRRPIVEAANGVRVEGPTLMISALRQPPAHVTMRQSRLGYVRWMHHVALSMQAKQ
jgi:hypothetical protein